MKIPCEATLFRGTIDVDPGGIRVVGLLWLVGAPG